MISSESIRQVLSWFKSKRDDCTPFQPEFIKWTKSGNCKSMCQKMCIIDVFGSLTTWRLERSCLLLMGAVSWRNMTKECTAIKTGMLFKYADELLVSYRLKWLEMMNLGKLNSVSVQCLPDKLIVVLYWKSELTTEIAFWKIFQFFAYLNTFLIDEKISSSSSTGFLNNGGDNISIKGLLANPTKQPPTVKTRITFWLVSEACILVETTQNETALPLARISTLPVRKNDAQTHWQLDLLWGSLNGVITFSRPFHICHHVTIFVT